MIAILIVNGIRYNKEKYCDTALKQRWGIEPERRRIFKERLLIAYIIFSTVSCLGLAIYLGSKKW
jgi:uncharacterized BrkB/YihY/UPF0761 family membrane protein